MAYFKFFVHFVVSFFTFFCCFLFGLWGLKCKANYLTCENKNQGKKSCSLPKSIRQQSTGRQTEWFEKVRRDPVRLVLDMLLLLLPTSEITHAIQDKATTSFKPCQECSYSSRSDHFGDGWWWRRHSGLQQWPFYSYLGILCVWWRLLC